MQKRGRLLFAGPLNMEQVAPKAPVPIGSPSGLLVIRAASKVDAEELAHQDPFHVSGFRKNVVHAWSVRFGQSELSAALGGVLETSLR